VRTNPKYGFKIEASKKFDIMNKPEPDLAMCNMHKTKEKRIRPSKSA
jgi:hypothetical protein